jgi:hypothetical protein
VNNLFGAVRSAEIKRGAQTSDLVVVDAPLSIPKLEQCNSVSNTILRIPICGLRKAWRKENKKELQELANLINFGLTVKPFIDSFLSKHPVDVKLDIDSQFVIDSEVIPNDAGATQHSANQDNQDSLPSAYKGILYYRWLKIAFLDFPIDPELLLDNAQPQITGVELAKSKSLCV